MGLPGEATAAGVGVGTADDAETAAGGAGWDRPGSGDVAVAAADDATEVVVAGGGGAVTGAEDTTMEGTGEAPDGGKTEKRV